MIFGLLRKLSSAGAFVFGAWLLFHYGISDINSQVYWDGKGKKEPAFIVYQNDPDLLSSALFSPAWAMLSRKHAGKKQAARVY